MSPSNQSPPSAQKKKYRNPFTYLFTRQYKSTPTSHLDEQTLKQGLFGMPLCDASKIGSQLWNLRVPDPVALCFQEISQRGLATEGIFRLSGATSEVILLENQINMCSSDERKRIDPSQFDIHTLTSLVKKYLRELPEPVIPNAFHDQFHHIDFVHDPVHQIAGIIVKLPFYNRHIIHAILLMSAKIQYNVETNMMCPEALATVFAPVCTGLEQSLRNHMAHKSHSTPTSNTMGKKSKKHNYSLIDQTPDIEQHIKRNKNWTNIWKIMIEQHETLIAVLDRQMYQFSVDSQRSDPDLTWRQHRVYYNHNAAGNRSLPSPFSTSGSMVPLPNDIMMAQFYPIQGASVIPVASLLTTSTSATTSNYRQSPPIFDDYAADTNTTTNTGHGCQNSMAKKTSFFPKSNTLRKILSASTLR